MSRKKSGKRAATTFLGTTQRLRDYVEEVDGSQLTDQATTWAYEAALMKTSVAFERLMLDCLIAALNSDTEPFSTATGITFPKHLTEKVCEFLITGGRYFDFRGKDGLVDHTKKVTGTSHYLHTAVTHPKYHHTLELLISLRNYAAHESPQSRKKAKREIAAYHLSKKKPTDAELAKANAPGSAGSWIKRQERFDDLLNNLDSLAKEIHAGAPY